MGASVEPRMASWWVMLRLRLGIFSRRKSWVDGPSKMLPGCSRWPHRPFGRWRYGHSVWALRSKGKLSERPKWVTSTNGLRRPGNRELSVALTEEATESAEAKWNLPSQVTWSCRSWQHVEGNGSRQLQSPFPKWRGGKRDNNRNRKHKMKQKTSLL